MVGVISASVSPPGSCPGSSAGSGVCDVSKGWVSSQPGSRVLDGSITVSLFLFLVFRLDENMLPLPDIMKVECLSFNAGDHSLPKTPVKNILLLSLEKYILQSGAFVVNHFSFGGLTSLGKTLRELIPKRIEMGPEAKSSVDLQTAAYLQSRLMALEDTSSFDPMLSTPMTGTVNVLPFSPARLTTNTGNCCSSLEVSVLS